MRLGLTYDLRSAYLAEGYGEVETAEFDRDDTIDALAQGLSALGHQVDRIGHARQLAARLVAGDRWDLVFNIAEGLRGIGREAVVPALLDLYGIPYTFSDPLVMALTLHKGMTKRVIRDAGLPTPAFAVVETAREAAAVGFPGPWFVKPVAEGTGKGVTPSSVVRSREELGARCEAMVEEFRQPALVETFLPGREVTVAVLGTGPKANALGTIEVILLPEAEAEVYSYVNKERCEELVKYKLIRPEADPMVAAAEDLAVACWRVLGCRDGGRVDLRCDAEGRPLFLEVNPLAGIHPEHSDLPIICNHIGVPYLELLRRIVDSAAERVPGGEGAP
jgi:D-alanine-D-alanine ligase